MFENPLPFIFILALVVSMFIRGYYGRDYRQNVIEEARGEGALVGMTMAGWGIGLLLPLFVYFSPWLDFANHASPVWLQWLGAVVFLVGDWLLWRSHVDLGRNWSATLEVREGHTLVEDGIYQRIRHPMYTAHFLIGIGVVLLVPNWLVGLLPLVSMIFLYLLRVAKEEKLLLDTFGEEYRDYMQRTGRLLPKM